MNELEYRKSNHYIDSPSVFWDLDSLIYIVALGLIIWGIIRLVSRIRNSRKMSFAEYISKYFYSAYVPIFLLFFVQLLISGVFIPTNIIICVLPLVYGLIIQIIFLIVRKIRT